MKISFKSYAINSKLCTYLKVEILQESLEINAQGFSDKVQHQKTIDETANNIEESKNHLMDLI